RCARLKLRSSVRPMTSTEPRGKATWREVPAAATITIDHPARYGRACRDGFAVVSSEGTITVVDGSLQVVRQIDVGVRVDALSVCPSTGQWAWIAQDRLWIGDPTNSSSSRTPLPGKAACHWSPSGRALWVAHGTGNHVHVEIRTPDNRVVRATTVAVQFG